MQETSPNNIFRFMQLRPPGAFNESLSLIDQTEFVNELIPYIKAGDFQQIPKFAGQFLERASFDLGLNHQMIKDTFSGLETKNGLVGALNDIFGDELPHLPELTSVRIMLSDIMIAAYFSGRSVAQPQEINLAFRIYEYLHQRLQGVSFENASPLFSRPLSLPTSLIDARKYYLSSINAAQIQPSGMAELLVVKQHIKRYELTEIARVENIIAGESTEQTMRNFQQSEQFYFTEIETTEEQETTIDTTERFELSRETSRTIQEDSQLRLGLTVTGSLGPYVEFTSTFGLEKSVSEQQSETNAMSYAQDIVSRSVEKISQRVLEQRSLRIRKESEQTTSRALVNDSEDHRRGVFQFVDKVFEAQVFNYGYRQMYDLVVMEPAHYILQQMKSRAQDAEPELPDPPTKPTLTLASMGDNLIEDETAFRRFIDTYAEPVSAEIEPPPQEIITIDTSFTLNLNDEGGEPINSQSKMVDIPAGYKIVRSKIAATFTSDDAPKIFGMVGNNAWHSKRKDLKDDIDEFEIVQDYWTNEPEEDGDVNIPIIGPTRMAVSVTTYETGNFAINVTIECGLTAEHKLKWKMDAYTRILEAYADRLTEYNRLVEALEAAAALQLEDGNVLSQNPAFKRSIEKAELKKQCLALLTQNQFYTDESIFESGTNKRIHVENVLEKGSYIRFFEHAFEWEQLQYVFYPYYWANPSQWDDKVFAIEEDARFLEFLSAGAARVVVPVRPGFEQALQYFMDTGLLWNGQASPPNITSPLYLSIVDEIKARTGADQGEVQVGDPWDIHVPTNLLWLRDDSALPEWARTSPDAWEWSSEPLKNDPTGTGTAEILCFVLLNSQNGNEIVTLEEGMIIDLPSLETNSFTIRVDTDPQDIGSVVIKYANQRAVIENHWPYTMNVNLSELSRESGSPTEYECKATIFSEDNVEGVVLDTLSIRFFVQS